MAKETGLSWTVLSVADATGAAQDIRNDVTNLDFSTPRAVQDVTGIDKAAHERLLLLADFSLTLHGVFNPTLSHEVFSTVPSTSVVRATDITVNGETLNNNCLYSDYALTRSNSGELTWQVPGALADGNVPTWAPAS